MIIDAVVCAEKQWIQSVTESGTMHRWNLADGEPMLPPIPLSEGLLDARFSTDGDRVAVITRDHRIELWRVGSVAERIGALDDSMISNAGRVALSSDGNRIAACPKRASTIHVFNAEDGKLIRSFRQPHRITGRFCLSDDGSRLAAGLVNGQVMVWNVESGESLPHESPHERYIMAVAFSPDGRFVASASNDRTARIWDLKTGKALPWMARHRTGVTSVSFSPDGKWLITGSLDFSTCLWEMASGRLACDPLSHQVGVSGIALSSSSEIVCCALGFGKMMSVWRPREAHGAPFEIDFCRTDTSPWHSARLVTKSPPVKRMAR